MGPFTRAILYSTFNRTIPVIRAGRGSFPSNRYIRRVGTTISCRSKLVAPSSYASSNLDAVLPLDATQWGSDKESRSKRSFDVVIIGGGASGVAVATQLAKRTERGGPIKSVLLVEKSDSVGPGLAYSDACSGTLLNVPADIMGLDDRNPRHFRSWAQSHFDDLHTDPYLPRLIYGQYLKLLIDKVCKTAIDYGLRWEMIKNEAIQIEDVGQTFFVTLGNNVVLRTQKVVLAIGNFFTAVYPELEDTPGYIHSPWPTCRLKEIPVHSSVCIIGSGLTAVDAAIFLADNGHRGPIMLLSRNGQLPKVQGTYSTFRRSYLFHSLARTVEHSRGPNTLSIIVDAICKELRKEGSILDMSHLLRPSDPLGELRTDVSNAASGHISWQAVLLATTPVIERYWNCMSLEEKNIFLGNYLRMWNRYRHTIPLHTARKLLILMESGQVRVGAGQGARWTGSEFLVSENGTETRSNFLIEAAGQEYNPHKTKSPLLRQLLSSGLLQAHPAGGVSVDFASLAARDRLYVIGSMTRGVHFYTNGVQRNLAHAIRISDHISGELLRRPLQIAFFVSGDLLSQLILSKLVSQLRTLGHMPFIFIEDDNPRLRGGCKLRELHFFERELLNDHIMPFLTGWKPILGEPFLTINQLEYRYGILVQKHTAASKEYTRDLLRKHHIDICVSFGGAYEIQLHNDFMLDRTLLTLQIGRFPVVKAALAIYRAIRNGQRFIDYDLCCTKDGNRRVVGMRRCPLNPQKAALNHLEDIHESGVHVLISAVEQMSRDRVLPQIPLWTPPEKDDKRCASQMQFLDAQGIKEMLTRFFSPADGEEQLRSFIDATTRRWYLQNKK